jgi:MinD superfamily P-loop ATPase
MSQPPSFSASPDVLADACAACGGECLECCFNDAIVFEAGVGYRVVEDNCAGCGACIPACAHGLIEVWQGVATIATNAKNATVTPAPASSYDAYEARPAYAA